MGVFEICLIAATVFLAPFLGIALGVVMVIRTVRAGQKPTSPEDMEQVQGVYAGLEKMAKRVDSLESILVERTVRGEDPTGKVRDDS